MDRILEGRDFVMPNEITDRGHPMLRKLRGLLGRSRSGAASADQTTATSAEATAPDGSSFYPAWNPFKAGPMSEEAIEDIVSYMRRSEGRPAFSRAMYENACAMALAMKREDWDGVSALLQEGVRLSREHEDSLDGMPRLSPQALLESQLAAGVVDAPPLEKAEALIRFAKGPEAGSNAKLH